MISSGNLEYSSRKPKPSMSGILMSRKMASGNFS
jgi:hypothetical protein